MNLSKEYYKHKSVLLEESVRNLITNKNGIYIDATFGLGGHSYEILKRISKKAKLISLDQDKESIKKNLIKDKRLHLFHSNFIYIQDILNKKLFIEKVSGILADLGISYFQINNPKRGFSHKLNCILDMRMDQEKKYSAKNVINESSYEKLSYIFKEYGDFNNTKKMVGRILEKRIIKNISTSSDLLKIFFIRGSFKERKRFFSRLFQSIRIEVNDEINKLKNFLYQSSDIIEPGGRIAIISYHSIEDRIVKNFFKNGIIFSERKPDKIPFKMIHKKVIKPTYIEVKKNPRSRSAKLRIAEKL
ncbi:16S rRNA (cytosine(1402)-N(4))-methyltransferase RsmH [Blattabacterium cuenoti]|uniref:16S rRNA (cytosine(1402)-N(4))-methyltransferase RsmH n=1 Tax=Blattabacterium cuenoti TaxID=1653831 RepID=UPI00163CEC7E|nr:16S rRNA (cytosine(1402)-N(4))-methyltransferase RsmH [Blattabacterium cuenoti]